MLFIFMIQQTVYQRLNSLPIVSKALKDFSNTVLLQSQYAIDYNHTFLLDHIGLPVSDIEKRYSLRVVTES